MTTCQVRLKAAELLEAQGWCQGGFHDGAGRHCIRGAVGEFAVVMGTNSPDVYAAMGFKSPVDASLWNDAHGRTKEEVIARLRDGCTEPAS